MWEELDGGRKANGDLSVLVGAEVATLFDEKELRSVVTPANVRTSTGNSHSFKVSPHYHFVDSFFFLHILLDTTLVFVCYL